MNALPWVMTQLLAGEHRRDLTSTAARRRRLVTDSAPHDRTGLRRRLHLGA